MRSIQALSLTIPSKSAIQLFSQATLFHVLDIRGRGFSFLKDKSSALLRCISRKERIEALAMIKVLALMIYSVAEWMVRNGCVKQESSFQGS
jgi:transposase